LYRSKSICDEIKVAVRYCIKKVGCGITATQVPAADLETRVPTK